MSLSFTGYKNGKCYFKGLEMPADKVWAILRAKKIQAIRGAS